MFFHWANKDQHYVKSGEAFRDYAFAVSTVGGEYRVRFRLAEATVPKDNTKGDTRFFFPLAREAAFDLPAPAGGQAGKATRTFVVPFHYRLPTEAEAAKYGKNAKAQEAILDEAAPKILGAVTDEFLRSALAAPSASLPTAPAGQAGGSPAEGEEPPTLLRRRLRHFTKKNTTDYFVHKDLGAFLRQELEFFVRDQVVHEADLEGDFDAKRRTIRVFRKLAETLITFLAQVEDAQKRLFEKKKFVLRTDYLVAIQHVPHALWPDVLANKAQLAEWKDLFALAPKSDLFNFKGQVNERVLEQSPTLVVDTAHFPAEFMVRLLSTVDAIEERLDGLLVRSENWQALRLVRSLISQVVKCIYIDPPYNTGSPDFVYKDKYRHSTWLSMMHERLALVRELLTPDGVVLVSIDEEELPRLRLLLNHVFGEENFVGTLVWEGATDNNPTRIAVEHEYVLCYAKSKDKLPPVWSQENPEAKRRMLEAYEAIAAQTRNVEEIQNRFRQFIKTHRNELQPLTHYDRVDKDGPYTGSRKVHNPGREGYRYDIIHPRTRKPCKQPARGYRYPEARMRELLATDKIIFGEDESQIIQIKVYLKDYVGTLKSVIKLDSRVGANALENLFGNRETFKNPKPVELIENLLGFTTGASDVILDSVAGSGTTGHAVINLNREDGERRKFILVEMGDYFDTVLLPRIKKVMFTPEWKDGKPARLPTKEEAERTPRLVKVLRLESYEDALHNTFSDRAVERLAEREKAHRDAVGEDGYRLRYLVKLPVDASDSMLNLAKLEHPFDYTLEVLTDHGPKTETVDLVETFNWLYGLRVHRLLTWVNEKDLPAPQSEAARQAGKAGNLPAAPPARAERSATSGGAAQAGEKGGRSYRAVVASDREGKKRILVVWRDMTGLDPKVERPFLEAKTKDLGTFEEQWINGDTAAKGFASLDGLFKRLMEEGER